VLDMHSNPEPASSAEEGDSPSLPAIALASRLLDWPEARDDATLSLCIGLSPQTPCQTSTTAPSLTASCTS
jgi:hypothetical protein